MESDSSV